MTERVRKKKERQKREKKTEGGEKRERRGVGEGGGVCLPVYHYLSLWVAW